jgi:hypothetical protein
VRERPSSKEITMKYYPIEHDGRLFYFSCSGDVEVEAASRPVA